MEDGKLGLVLKGQRGQKQRKDLARGRLRWQGRGEGVGRVVRGGKMGGGGMSAG